MADNARPKYRFWRHSEPWRNWRNRQHSSLGHHNAPARQSKCEAASDRDERDRAIKKIEDAKEQLEFLKRAGFTPEVIARLAGDLLRSVSTAAQQFGQATGAGLLSSMGLGATNPLTGITATSDGAGAVKRREVLTFRILTRNSFWLPMKEFQ